MTNEEKTLLRRLAVGDLDGIVGDDLTTSRGSTIWKAIKKGIPAVFKQGPDRKFFDGKENVRIAGALTIKQKWISDEQKLEFLRRFGWLMKDPDVKSYSAKFKGKI